MGWEILGRRPHGPGSGGPDPPQLAPASWDTFADRRLPDLCFPASTHGHSVHGHLIIQVSLGDQDLNPAITQRDRCWQTEPARGWHAGLKGHIEGQQGQTGMRS
jgi:hypothetical protein